MEVLENLLNSFFFFIHFVVLKQVDRHWPYLTARESLTFATKLFNVADAADVPDVVNGVLDALGLEICADTQCARLSGGQKRRLSLAVALLKQPTMLFLVSFGYGVQWVLILRLTNINSYILLDNVRTNLLLVWIRLLLPPLQKRSAVLLRKRVSSLFVLSINPQQRYAFLVYALTVCAP